MHVDETGRVLADFVQTLNTQHSSPDKQQSNGIGECKNSYFKHVPELLEMERENTCETYQLRRLYDFIVTSEHVGITIYVKNNKQGSNFGIISEFLKLAKNVYRLKYILLGHNVFYNVHCK